MGRPRSFLGRRPRGPLRARPPDVGQPRGGHRRTGIQKDRTWQQTYESLRETEPDIPIEWVPAVHEALCASFTEWIHEPDLLRRLADSPVPMTFIAADHDIRPSWPLQQLAALVPNGSFEVVPGVPHDFWSTHPEVWTSIISRACV